jgi:hypothetical protein
MKKLYFGLVVAVATLASAIASMPASAFSVLSETVNVNLQSQEASFKIEFDKSPDFFTVDSVGRAANSFQYFINFENDGSPLNYDLLDVIIRGDEIKNTGSIIIRNAFTSGYTDPNSGGWGSIRGSVPFLLSNNIINFNVSLAVLGDLDGLFTYDLETYEFGGMSSRIRNQQSHIINVPEPLTILGSIAATGFMAAFNRIKSKKEE